MPELDKYVPEPVIVRLEWWEVDCGDIGVKKLTEKQMLVLLQAEAQNKKLVMFDDFVISVPFIRGANKKKRLFRESDLRHNQISEEEKLYVIEDKRNNLMLKGKSNGKQ